MALCVTAAKRSFGVACQGVHRRACIAALAKSRRLGQQKSAGLSIALEDDTGLCSRVRVVTARKSKSIYRFSGA